jgi:hypothetical protein
MTTPWLGLGLGQCSNADLGRFISPLVLRQSYDDFIFIFNGLDGGDRGQNLLRDGGAVTPRKFISKFQAP